MSIVRAPRPEADFVQIRNDVARDSRLSYKARGILVEVLSRPDNWEASADSLARWSKEGRTAILTGLKELRDAGYVVTERTRVEGGRFVTRNIFFDTPQSGYPTAVYPTADNRTTENPTTENLTVLEHSPKNTNQEHLEKKKEEEAPTVTADAPLIAQAFDDLWKKWPTHKRRADAWRVWQATIDRYDLIQVMEGAGAYISHQSMTDEFPQSLHKWLEGERWTDEYECDVRPMSLPMFDPSAPRCDHGAEMGRCALCRLAVSA